MKNLIYFLLFVFLNTPLFANNLQISNVSIANQNVAGGYTYVNFNISWENSWRDGENYDAAWIFLKYRINGGSWNHVMLGSTPSDHVAPSGATIETPTIDTGRGVFIYRSSVGSGTNNFQNIQLKWRYQLNGLASTQYVDVKVFGIEMVNIPQGAYYAGDGSPDYVFGELTDISGVNPYQITSEDAITLGGNTANSMQNHNSVWDDWNSTTSKTLPAAYPKGYNAFYCMKYEITQEQYTDFLNTLDLPNQKTRVENQTIFLTAHTTTPFVMCNLSYPGNGSSIRCPLYSPFGKPVIFFCDFNNNNVGNENGDGQNLGMNFMSWYDGLAYADWACLRPMTELEHEKAARGPVYPVPHAFAWGTTEIEYCNTVSDRGTNSERPLNGNANDGTIGPMRVGSFANQNSTRYSSGASFYGIMNMADNSSEYTVALALPDSRNFTNMCGDGAIGTQHNVSTWPVHYIIKLGSMGISYRYDIGSDGISRYYAGVIRLARPQ